MGAVYTINNIERELGRPHTSVSARVLTWSEFPVATLSVATIGTIITVVLLGM